MCTNPILIRNRRFRCLDRSVPGSFIKVPCGHCDECLTARANDIYVRTRYEFEDALRHGGVGFMCCLTYSPDLVPYYKGMKVFNKKHVIDFIKRLRTNLDRYFHVNFGHDAPDFKYVVTSEYGTDPTRTHSPHYHLLFAFHHPISLTAFRYNYKKSLCVSKGNKKIPVFGYIFQCDLLDFSRGGIKYSGKYILKDLQYEKQRKEIKARIAFEMEKINTEFHIKSICETYEDEFYNRCIRSRKDYRKAVSERVLPYRHMLQFYMCSNDLGCSCIIKKYGRSILSLPTLNFEGFPFRLPRQVKERIRKNYGDQAFDELNKNIFLNFFKSASEDLIAAGKLTRPDFIQLFEFARLFIFPRSGHFYLVNPEGYDLSKHLSDTSSLVDSHQFICDLAMFRDNDFYVYREALYHVLSMYDSKDMREFRASVAKLKFEKQTAQYEQKKRNKPTIDYNEIL